MFNPLPSPLFLSLTLRPILELTQLSIPSLRSRRFVQTKFNPAQLLGFIQRHAMHADDAFAIQAIGAAFIMAEQSSQHSALLTAHQRHGRRARGREDADTKLAGVDYGLKSMPGRQRRRRERSTDGVGVRIMAGWLRHPRGLAAHAFVWLPLAEGGAGGIVLESSAHVAEDDFLQLFNGHYPFEAHQPGGGFGDFAAK